TTVASLLKQRGYATGAVGKWHVGLEWQPKPDTRPDPEEWGDLGEWDYAKPILGGPTHLGFNSFFGIAGSLDMPPYAFIEDDHTVGIPDAPKDVYNPQQKEGFMTPGWSDEAVDSTFAEKAVAFIEQNADGPFFLYVTPSAPHRPCMPPDFAKGKSQAGPRGDMVWVVDWMVGQVTDALDRQGIAENTLIIVTSDNGAQPYDVDHNFHDHKSCGDLRGYKADIWDGGHREPFIARWPARVAAGTVSNEPICLADLLATCADIVGSPLPENGAEDSVSILPALLGQTQDEPLREAIIHHSARGMFGVRQGKWKVAFCLGSGGFSQPNHIEPEPGGPTGQLYDLEADPAETTNLWQQHPDIVADLGRLLDTYRERGRSR
ncbi:arylsulfatase, partial [bacterium]|nr:arylsulfatase [bacterium]